MGDRAQIAICQSNDFKDRVYLYSHWGGDMIYEALHKGLIDGKSRWGDPSYLTRIIFDRMKGSEISDLTGFGIGTHQHGDIQYVIPVIYCRERHIHFEPSSFYPLPPHLHQPISFEDYIKLDDPIKFVYPSTGETP